MFQTANRNPYGIRWHLCSNGRIRDNNINNQVAGHQSYSDPGSSTNVMLEFPIYQDVSKKSGRFNSFSPLASGDGILNSSEFVLDLGGAGNSRAFGELGSPVSVYRVLATGTNAANTTVVGYRFKSDWISRRGGAKLTVKFYLDTPTSLRVFIGFFSGSATVQTNTADPLANKHGIGIMADPAASGNFRSIRNTGTATSTFGEIGVYPLTTTPIASAVNTVSIAADEANARWQILWNHAPINYTTTIPASAQAMGFGVWLGNTTAARDKCLLQH